MNSKDGAILHMLGQVMDGGAGWPITTAADVAKWLGCTRQNANLKLRQWMGEGLVERVENYWRPNSVKYRYQLTPNAYKEYQNHGYLLHYLVYLGDSRNPF